MGAFSKIISRFWKPESESAARERRASYREAVDCIAIAMVGGRTLTVSVDNISPGGAFLSPRIEAVKGSRFMLRVPEAGISIQACIVRQGQHGTGVCFEDTSSAERMVEKFAAA